jgi:FkbM family methyltransferase
VEKVENNVIGNNVKSCGLRCFVYLVYLKVIWFLRRHLGIKAWGLGFVASKIGCEFDFQFRGVPFRFMPYAARSYCLLPAGIANEPETHLFLGRVLAGRSDVVFVDVGASIGEFAITMAHDIRVSKVMAFEPHPESNRALNVSAQKMPTGKLEIIRKGVASTAGTAVFELSTQAPMAAGLRSLDATADGGAAIELCTLDDTVDFEAGRSVIVLIDIEGGELDALKGGLAFIRRSKPLIVFEYNGTTRKHFRLDEAASLLGDEYHLFRMRSEDGLLDSDFSNTWNVAALPKSGPWRDLQQVRELFYP